MTDKLTVNKAGSDLEYLLHGNWKCGIDDELAVIKNEVLTPGSKIHLNFDLDSWGDNLVCFLFSLRKMCFEKNITVTMSGLPQGAERLLTIAESVPEREGAAADEKVESIFQRVGEATIDIFKDIKDAIKFTGDVAIATKDFLFNLSHFAWKDFMNFMRDCGPSALPIIALITFLVGLILAFVGAIQLQLFGAQIFVADLVGIGMVRELAAIMAGIVMAGRTGAAYAAQLGTMQVNEEVDALETMGISTIFFLVLPRMFSLIIIMPMLCVFANIMGVLGGMFVGVFVLKISPILYYQQTINAIRLQDFTIGIIMSIIFGVLVSGAGCLRGMQCGRSSAAVGKATTSAVVTGIVCIIVSTAIITVICDFLGV